MGAKVIWEIFVTFQVCCEPKTALKLVFKIKIIRAINDDCLENIKHYSGIIFFSLVAFKLLHIFIGKLQILWKRGIYYFSMYFLQDFSEASNLNSPYTACWISRKC